MKPQGAENIIIGDIRASNIAFDDPPLPLGENLKVLCINPMIYIFSHALPLNFVDHQGTDIGIQDGFETAAFIPFDEIKTFNLTFRGIRDQDNRNSMMESGPRQEFIEEFVPNAFPAPVFFDIDVVEESKNGDRLQAFQDILIIDAMAILKPILHLFG